MDIWVESRVIDYLGTSDRVNEEMESCDCVVLPSYREGLSKVLIEASSMSLPIITYHIIATLKDYESFFLIAVFSHML